MSWWTHIRGMIEVCVRGRTQPEIRYILETVLDHLPRVTGSEGDMNVHIVQEKGHNVSSDCDEFGQTTNNLTDLYGQKTYKHGYLFTQDAYVVVVEGDFRDRMFETTKREFANWLCRLAKRVYVENICVKIFDDYGKNIVVSDEKPYGEMYESYDNWTNYLMWEADPLSEMPVVLMNKYRKEEYIKEEIDRRNRWRDKFD